MASVMMHRLATISAVPNLARQKRSHQKDGEGQDGQRAKTTRASPASFCDMSKTAFS